MIHIYTDGACSHNGSWNGGWGFVAVRGDSVLKQEGGGEKNTTNNRMEMMAFIKGMEYAHELGEEFTLYTDSAYIHNAFSQGWIANWERNGWRNAKKQPVANQDLWRKILEYPKPNIVKVKGHAGDKYNEMADDLAVLWRDKQ